MELAAPKASSRIFYMDVLRLAACIFVVGNHTLGSVFITMQRGTEQTALLAWFFLCKTGVPIFLMLSGALMMRSERDMREIFKKTGQLVVVLVLASLYVWCFQLEGGGAGGFNLSEFLTALFIDPILLNYWYLYTAAGLYLMTPMLGRMVRAVGNAEMCYYGLMWIVFAGVAPMLGLYGYPTVSSHLYLPLFSSYIGYYIMGYFLASRSKGENEGRLVYLSTALACCGLWYLVAATLSEQGRGASIRLLLDDARLAPTMLMACGLFIVTRHFLEGRDIPPLLSSVTARLADATFGVYIFHSLAIPGLSGYRAFLLSSLPAGSAVATYTATVFTLSLAMGLVAKQLPIVRELL